MKRTFNILTSCFVGALALTDISSAEDHFTDSYGVSKADLAAEGTSRYFNLTPGFQLVLAGKEDDEPITLTITVLNETKKVDGVETRIVEEKEMASGRISEVSRNYFAISKRTSDVFYFGEDVDNYKDGKVVNHEGSWLSGENGARFGLAMPGTPLVGARYQQEVAPDVAMDRAEVVSVSEKLDTAAGKFENCVATEESTPLEKGKERKLYAPGIGVIRDANLTLVRYVQPAK